MAAEPSAWAWLGNFAQGFMGQRPIFARGAEIGYWTSAGGLCSGQVVLHPQYASIPASEWTTKDDFWRDVPVSQFCAAAGFRPAWMSDKDLAAAKAAAPPGAASIQAPLKAAGELPATVADLAKGFSSGAKWAAIGGIAVVALVLILKSDGGPRGYYR